MSLSILAVYEGDFYTRHELGFIASLTTKYKVTVLNIEDSTNKIEYNKAIIKSDEMHSVPIVKIPAKYLHNRNIIKEIRTLMNSYDILISSARRALMLSKQLKDNTPLVLRLWSIRANKMIDNLRHGSYKDLLIFIPSLLANAYYINNANATITVDHATFILAKQISKFTLHKPIIKIYPPYGALMANNDSVDEEKLNELLSTIEKFRNNYTLGVTVLRKSGEYLKFEALPHAIFYYLIAKKNPDIPIFILGSTRTEFVWKTKIEMNKIPKNMIFLNDYQIRLPDWIIERIYRSAKIIINYISNRSISNRLIEALYFQKPIITNKMAQILHPELIHGIHIHVVTKEEDYPNEIRKIYKNDDYLAILSKNAGLIYRYKFSPEVNLRLFNYLVRELIYR